MITIVREIDYKLQLNFFKPIDTKKVNNPANRDKLFHYIKKLFSDNSSRRVED